MNEIGREGALLPIDLDRAVFCIVNQDDSLQQRLYMGLALHNRQEVSVVALDSKG